MPTLLINQGTNSAVYFEDLGGTAFMQGVAIDHGTVNVGALPNLPGGTINLVSGLNSGTITVIPNIPGGTVGVVSNLTNGSIKMTAGTVNAGTINTGTINAGTVDILTLPNTPGGTLGVVSSVANLVKGTITKVEGGTLGEVTLVPTVSSVSNLVKGTITKLEGGTLGEVTNVAGGTVTRLLQGSVNVTAGTVNAGTVNTGTMNAGTVNTGTVNAGTINAGTITLVPTPSAQVLSAGTTTSATIGTLVSAPASGNGIYINAFSLNALSGTPEIILSYALQASGNQVVNRGAYVPGAGIAMTFPYASYFGTAAVALTWNVVAGAGTVSYMVNYTTKGTP